MSEPGLTTPPDIEALTIEVLRGNFSSPEERNHKIETIRSENARARENAQLRPGEMTVLERNLPLYMHRNFTRDLQWYSLDDDTTQKFVDRASQEISVLRELGLDDSVLRSREQTLVNLAFTRGSFLLTSQGVDRFVAETNKMGISEDVRRGFVDRTLANSVMRPDNIPEHFAAGIEGITDHNDPGLRSVNRLERVDQLAAGLNVKPEELKRSAFELIKNASTVSEAWDTTREARAALGLDRGVSDTQVALLNGLDRSVSLLGVDRAEVDALIDNVGKEMLGQIKNAYWVDRMVSETQKMLERAKQRFSGLSDGVKARLQEGFDDAIKVPEAILANEQARVAEVHKRLTEESEAVKAKYEEQGIRFVALKDAITSGALNMEQTKELSVALQNQYLEYGEDASGIEVAVLRPTSYDDLQRLLQNYRRDNLDSEGDGYNAVSANGNSGFDLYAVRPDLTSSHPFVELSNIGKLQDGNKQVILSGLRDNDSGRRAQWKVPDANGEYWKSNPTFVIVRDPKFPR